MKDQKSKALFFKHIVRKIFLEDWAMKLLALVITVGLWFGVTVLSRGKEASDRFTVPLNFRVLDNAAITNAPVQEVEIRVRGVDDKIEQIRRNDLIVYVDLTELTPGERVLTLTPENVSVPLPEGVKVVDLQPSRIAVTIEAIEEKEIEVRAVTQGSPESGFEVYGEPSVIPQKVKVRGPATLVKSVDQLLTDKISLDGRREDFTARQIPVGVSNAKVTIYNTVVDVLVTIGEKRIEKGFVLPVSDSPGKTVSITLYGPRTLLEKAKPDTFKVEMLLGENGMEPRVTLPTNLQNVTVIKKVKLNFAAQ